MCHTGLAFCIGSPRSLPIASPVLFLQSCVTLPNSKNRRYTVQRMGYRTRLISNPLRMFMNSHSRSSPPLSHMITATLIPIAVLLFSDSRQQFRRSMKGQRAIHNLPVPLWIFDIMIGIISVTTMAMTIIATMVELGHYKTRIEVQSAVRPWPKMYTPMVIRDHDLFHASHPSA
ncbi:hypothetical protein F5148DRAFT_1189304 [Russula earlei]|uniref:Uncharacterized protein n=1 Tax=Russula earlei TaxID=71964 RepID=A0ACC0UC58_9AGAM|nr:hypothetical protein F5148DRAFT_1189304 [Russula earlei]